MEVSEIDERHRVHLPGRFTEGLDWLSGTQPKAVMKFERPGRISLFSWDQHGSLIAAKRDELLQKLPDEEVEAALLVLQDRYREVGGERGRLTLPIVALVHLFGGKEFDKYVFVVRTGSRVEIWSVAYRNEKLLKGSPFLDDMP